MGISNPPDRKVLQQRYIALLVSSLRMIVIFFFIASVPLVVSIIDAYDIPE